MQAPLALAHHAAHRAPLTSLEAFPSVQGTRMFSQSMAVPEKLLHRSPNTENSGMKISQKTGQTEYPCTNYESLGCSRPAACGRGAGLHRALSLDAPQASLHQEGPADSSHAQRVSGEPRTPAEAQSRSPVRAGHLFHLWLRNARP